MYSYLPHYMRIFLKSGLSLPFFTMFSYLPHSMRISLKSVLNITYLFLLTSLCENSPQNWSVFTLLYDGYLSASLYENLPQNMFNIMIVNPCLALWESPSNFVLHNRFCNMRNLRYLPAYCR